MSSIVTKLSRTHRNRLPLHHFAGLLAFALFALSLPRPAVAESCADAFANWSSGGRLVHDITGSSTFSRRRFATSWDSLRDLAMILVSTTSAGTAIATVGGLAGALVTRARRIPASRSALD